MAGRTRTALVGLALASTVLWWQPAPGGQERRTQAPDGVRAAAAQGGSVPIIVGVRVDGYQPEGALAPSAAADQRAAMQAATSRVLSRLPAAVATRSRAFDFIPFFSTQVDANALLQLESDPDVVSIEENHVSYPTLAQSVPLIGGDTAWSLGYSGSGWTVAVLDTGVETTHSFLTGKTVSEGCYSNISGTHIYVSLCPGGVGSSTAPGSGVNCSSSLSGCYHGTHVAGIAAGKGVSFSGVAKDANIMAFQVFTNINGSIGSYSADQISAMNRVYALRMSYNIASVNMSLGGGRYFDQALCDSQNSAVKAAIDLLRSVNIATVIASGNNSWFDSMSAPGCISSAVSVGSTTKADMVSSFSNSVSFLQLLAPGSSINSSYPGNTFALLSGTSMATPHVAGAWAVLKQRRPSATVTEVLIALQSTGQPITDTRNGLVKPRIRVNNALTALTTPLLTIDQPTPGSTKTPPFPIGGWAIDRNALTGTGIDQVHVYAFPAGGGGAIPIGAASYGASRPDVGAAFGSQFTNSGWSITAAASMSIQALPNGNYAIVAYGRSTVTGTFNVQGSVAITVSGPVPNPVMFLDRPLSNGSSGKNVTVSGWAIDLGTPSGTGVDQVHVYAFPAGGGAPIGVAATYGQSRPDVGAAYGGQFTNSGFSVVMMNVPAGTYTITAYGHSTVSGTFILNATAANVTVNPTASNPQMNIDSPPPSASRTRPFTISGWAVDTGATSGTGVDAMHVYAVPAGGGAPIFIGAVTSFSSRPDVGAYLGNSQFNNCGYSITVNSSNLPAAGSYDFYVYAHSTVTGTFPIARIVRVNVS